MLSYCLALIKYNKALSKICVKRYTDTLRALLVVDTMYGAVLTSKEPKSSRHNGQWIVVAPVDF